MSTNPQLLDYIRQGLQKGVENEQIKRSLLASGWQSDDIEKAFNEIAQTTIGHRKKVWKKIVLIIVGFLGVLVVGILSLPLVLGLFAKDIPLIDDSDLQLQKISIPDKDNAYFDLIKLDKAIYEPKDKSQVIADMVAGKTWDNQLTYEIISQNAPAFEYFNQAARKPNYQNPESADPANITPNMVLTPMNSWRQMAQLSAIRALYLARQGKDKEAFDEAWNSVNVSQKIQESQLTLIEYLVATAMKRVGLETIQKVVSSIKLSSGELKLYAQSLNRYYENEDGLVTSFKGEYYFNSWVIDSLASGSMEALKSVIGEQKSQNLNIVKRVKDNYYFQPNKTKLLLAEYARASIKSVNEFCGKIRATEVKPLAITHPVTLYVEENAIGKILHDVLAVSLAGASKTKCREDLLVGATQAIIAIKAFKNDTNNYPISLNELVPDYLLSIPQDPFDEKPLKYSAEKKILYSVGEDGQDFGGSAGDNWREMADPTFFINF